MRILTRRSLATAATVVAIVGAGVAFAAWTSTGSGSGPAAAGTSVPLTVSVGAATGLYPTGSADVGFTVRNPNPYSVTLSNAHPRNIRVDAAHGSCNPAAVSGADVALSDVVPAGATSSVRTVRLSMASAATDACQGAVFTFDLVVTGASN